MPLCSVGVAQSFLLIVIPFVLFCVDQPPCWSQISLNPCWTGWTLGQSRTQREVTTCLNVTLKKRNLNTSQSAAFLSITYCWKHRVQIYCEQMLFLRFWLSPLRKHIFIILWPISIIKLNKKQATHSITIPSPRPVFRLYTYVGSHTLMQIGADPGALCFHVSGIRAGEGVQRFKDGSLNLGFLICFCRQAQSTKNAALLNVCANLCGRF